METREALRNRRRRIIWNNDGDDLCVTAFRGSPGSETSSEQLAPLYDVHPNRFESVDDYLKIRMKGKIDGTQVDSVFYQGCTVMPNWEFPPANTEALGSDPLKHAVDFAHSNGLEFFYSIRMNDIHHAVHQGVAYWSKFRMENIHLLQGDVDREWFDDAVVPWIRGETSKHPLSDAFEAGRKFYFPHEGAKPSGHRTWAAYDWGHRGVRDYYLGVIKEACRRYDIDGIELDWSRTPPFFKREHRANAPIMNSFVHRISMWLDEWGAKRGRPVLLAVKVPDSPARSLNFGLDAGVWIADGFVDILIGGFGARPFSCAISEWVHAGHAHRVPVYGCIENGLPGQAKSEIIRATAQRYLAEGADGVATYDHFFETASLSSLPPSWPHPSSAEILNEIGERETLRRLSKTYSVDMYGGDVELPVRLCTESGPSKAVIRFEIAEDPADADEMVLEVQWAEDVDPGRTSLNLNGAPVERGEPFVQVGENDSVGWHRHPVVSLREGINNLEITARPASPGIHMHLLKQVRAAIRYD